jgi:CBS domain-containing protein
MVAPNSVNVVSDAPSWPGSQDEVGDVMTRQIISFLPNMTLKQAATILMDNDISGAPVVDENGKLLGVSSRTDLLRVISEGRATEDAVSRLLDIEASEVGQSMTRALVTITPDTSIADAVGLMGPKRINRLLVINDEGQLMGIVTSADVVRTAYDIAAIKDKLSLDPGDGVVRVPVASSPGVISPLAPIADADESARDKEDYPLFLSKGSLWPGSQALVREYMAERVTTLPPDATLKQAARIMMDKETYVTGAPVVGENGQLLGIISRSDLLTDLLREDGSNEDAKVSDAMTRDPVTIGPDKTVLEAARLMYRRRLNRLIVTDEDGQLLGIIASSDVVRIALCDELSEVDYDEDS